MLDELHYVLGDFLSQAKIEAHNFIINKDFSYYSTSRVKLKGYFNYFLKTSYFFVATC